MKEKKALVTSGRSLVAKHPIAAGGITVLLVTGGYGLYGGLRAVRAPKIRPPIHEPLRIPQLGPKSPIPITPGLEDWPSVERLGQQAKKLAVREGVEKEKAVLRNSKGRLIEANNREPSSAISEFQERAIRIIVEVLDGVPPSKFESARTLKEALDKGFQRYSNGEYSYDSSGKLTISYETADGKFSGEVNTCRVVYQILGGSCTLMDSFHRVWPSEDKEINCKIVDALGKLCGGE